MELISHEIERANHDGGTPNTNAIFTLVPGKKETKTIALQRLVEEGFVSHQAGPRNSLLHSSKTPYREVDDPLADGYRPDPAANFDSRALDEF